MTAQFYTFAVIFARMRVAKFRLNRTIFAVTSVKPVQAMARVIVRPVQAYTPVLTRGRRAIVDIDFAVNTGKSWHANAYEFPDVV